MTRAPKIATLALALAAAGCLDPATDQQGGQLESLTGRRFAGKKLYLGWGHAGPGDPENMHNEVRYDVLHTHQVFTHELGGAYQGTKLVEQASDGAIEQAFQQLQSQMTDADMFIQYSSGHGYPQGLQYGGSYDAISDRILGLPAKEIVVFTMACYSGGLVDAFNQKRARWEGFAQQGRTLYVMSSSTVQQESSTGPGGDGLGGPTGSAGSAFGHSLWKALSGQADGAFDGVRDGFIELGEIEAYVKAKTREIGGHDPTTTGVYNPALIMSRVPQQKDGLSFPERGTAGWSEEQLREEIRRTDREWLRRPIR